MKQTLAIICGLLFIVLPGAAQSKNSQDKTTDKAQTDKAQIVATAEVTKIDAKKKTIQVRNLVDSPSTSSTDRSTRRPGGGGGSPGGGGYPGGGRRRGGGYPGGGYPGGGYPGGRTPGGGYPGGGGASTSQAKEYKVFITKDTILKLEDSDMEFKDIHVGDHVIVSGTPKGGGGDLEATTVTRKFQ